MTNSTRFPRFLIGAYMHAKKLQKRPNSNPEPLDHESDTLPLGYPIPVGKRHIKSKHTMHAVMYNKNSDPRVGVLLRMHACKQFKKEK